jgi:hypothetical protein
MHPDMAQELSANSIQFLQREHNPSKCADQLLDFISKRLNSPVSTSAEKPINPEIEDKKLQRSVFTDSFNPLFVRKTILIDLDMFRIIDMDVHLINVVLTEYIRRVNENSSFAIRFIDSNVVSDKILEVYRFELWSLTKKDLAGLRALVVNSTDLLFTHRTLDVLCRQRLINNNDLDSGGLLTALCEATFASLEGA